MFVVCVIQYMHVVSKLTLFLMVMGGWGGRWGVAVVYVCVCVIQYMHVVSKLTTFLMVMGGGVGCGEWQWSMYVCASFSTCMQ